MKFFVLLILFFTVEAYSQILDNKQGSAFTDKPFFNETFIRKNKIKKMTGKYTVKKPGDVMRPTEFKYVFYFDTLGHVTSTFETKNENGFKDTIINIYEYSSENLLAIHWRNDSHGFTSKHYKYDSLKRIVSEETRRDILDVNGKVEQSIILNLETMKYETYPNQIKKTIYNSYNLPYMEVYSTFNADGYLLEIEERLKMTSSSIKFIYEYNSKGLISSIKTTSEIEGKIAEEITFKYDVFGDLSEKEIYKNGQHMTDIQVIYNEDTKLLSSVLTRDVSTNYIYILRFQGIEYYLKPGFE
ncbi:MAG: hypothetical protein HYR91_13395 [Flavobacteriia bacterium]|nr:hypothetical protein [Flavobacteriia bacterium]